MIVFETNMNRLAYGFKFFIGFEMVEDRVLLIDCHVEHGMVNYIPFLNDTELQQLADKCYLHWFKFERETHE